MTVTIKQALDVAAGELPQSDSPRLDAELLLAHILSVERSHLYAHPERTLSCAVCQRFGGDEGGSIRNDSEIATEVLDRLESSRRSLIQPSRSGGCPMHSAQ